MVRTFYTTTVINMAKEGTSPRKGHNITHAGTPGSEAKTPRDPSRIENDSCRSPSEHTAQEHHSPSHHAPWTNNRIRTLTNVAFGKVLDLLDAKE